MKPSSLIPGYFPGKLFKFSEMDIMGFISFVGRMCELVALVANVQTLLRPSTFVPELYSRSSGAKIGCICIAVQISALLGVK